MTNRFGYDITADGKVQRSIGGFPTRDTAQAAADRELETIKRNGWNMKVHVTEAHEVSEPVVALPTCDMVEGCTEPITHLDSAGYVYCTRHGLQRRESEPCRKLRPFELNRIRAGKQVTRY